ncbi:MAG: hypothetical protein C4346_20235, partial [Chloroflexota bacterium]
EPAPDEERYSDPMFLWYVESPGATPYLLPASARIGLTQESPTFSPDGARLAFVVRVSSGKEPRTEIWTINLETGETAMLVSAEESAFDPAWSPDGHDIAFIGRSGNQLRC